IESDDTIAAGKVVATDPAANTLVSLGTSVTVHVSQGPSPLAVPDVAGTTLASAAAKLRTAGFQVAQLQEPSSSVRAGNVTRTDPAGGALAPKASPVNMFISTGPAPGAGGGCRETVGKTTAGGHGGTVVHRECCSAAV